MNFRQIIHDNMMENISEVLPLPAAILKLPESQQLEIAEFMNVGVDRFTDHHLIRLLAYCFNTPPNIPESIRSRHFCYSLSIWQDKLTSGRIHKRVLPLWKHVQSTLRSMSDETFQATYCRKCKACNEEGIFQLWRGSKVYCSLHCSQNGATDKKQAAKAIQDGESSSYSREALNNIEALLASLDDDEQSSHEQQEPIPEQELTIQQAVMEALEENNDSVYLADGFDQNNN